MMFFHAKECYYSVILDMSAINKTFLYFIVDQPIVTGTKIAG